MCPSSGLCSRLDYCNSADWFSWCSLYVSAIRSAAARLVSGACCHDHITPILTTLHWLPVCKTVMFKTVVLVWKCLNSRLPLWTRHYHCLCFRWSMSQVSLDRLTARSQSSNHNLPVELHVNFFRSTYRFYRFKFWVSTSQIASNSSLMMSGSNSPNLNPPDNQVWGQC